jgi:chromate transporter
MNHGPGGLGHPLHGLPDKPAGLLNASQDTLRKGESPVMNARSNPELHTTSLNTAGNKALKNAGSSPVKSGEINSGEIRPAHKSRPALYLDLFLTFAGIGVSTFGGGYAMLPILQREVCDKRGWTTEEELMDYYAIGQCTPGVIAVNTATFVGCRIAGTLGGIFATLGVIFPSIVIICIISAFLKNFAHSAWAVHAFSGIRAAVCVLILDAVVRMGKKSLVDRFCIAIFLAILAGSLFLHLSPILYVVLAGALGVLISRVTKRNA